MSAERTNLNICRPPEGLWVPFLVQTLEVNDDIPVDVDIEVEVQGLKGGKA